jgi:hypothetical protein
LALAPPPASLALKSDMFAIFYSPLLLSASDFFKRNAGSCCDEL